MDIGRNYMEFNSAEILQMTGQQITAAIKNKKITAVEVTSAYLARIDEVNDKFKAIVQLDSGAAIMAAKDIDDNLKQYSGKALLGVPMTVKNFCEVKGFKPDKGCRSLVGKPSEVDATAVARLREQGAVILGLTNTPEFSIGYETDNLVYGRTDNPYDFQRSPGGSSGGEAAALAAQCSLIGVGSDLSGSLRVPAHNTGVACLKMTQGRVPFTGSIPSDHAGLFSQFISCGPMARYVDDLITMSSLMVGPDGVDPHAVPVPWYGQDEVLLESLNIAYFQNDGLSSAESDIKKTVVEAAHSLKGFVANVVEARPECLAHVESIFENNIFLGGDHGQWLKDIMRMIQLHEPSPLLLEFLSQAEGSEFSVTALRNVWTQLDIYRKSMMHFFSHHDVLICPVAATVAKRHGCSFKEMNDFSYSVSFSLFSCPAAVLRCGVTESGLPIGVQIISKPWREDLVLKVAKQLELALGGWQLSHLLQAQTTIA